MSKEKKNRMVPELRFPEFKSSENWKEENLGSIFEERQETGFLELPLLSLTDKEGIIPQEETNRKNNSNSDKSKYLRVFPGDVAYNTMRMWEGRSAFVPIEGLVSPAYTVCKPNQENDGLFFSFYFKTRQLINQFHRYSQGLVKDTLNLKYEAFSGIKIFKPLKNEQQKIASCLSSLDDLITAHTQKLDALKAHKKGLMQQLFPAEGEKVPKLRFAEFKESGEWEEKMIGEISKVTTGNKDTQNKVDDGVYPFFVRSQTVERINSFSYEGEAILTSGDGVGVGKNFHYIDGKFDFHQRVYCIYDFADNVYGKYLYLYFSEHFNSRVMKMTAKNSVDSVRMAMITEMPILIPSLKEQQKIASCLSSLDELVTAQAEKIAQLKLHKKGLMQGLFPAVKENN